MSQFIIVDDSSSDITYTGSWSNTTSDVTNASFWNSMHGNLTFFQNTFHFTTGPASLSYSYSGTEVFIRGSFIGNNNASSTAMYPDFKVDDQSPNSVNPRVAQNGGQWSIHWSNLPPDHHKLTVDTIGVPSADQQNLLIDSIGYISLQEDVESINTTDIYLAHPNLSAPDFNFDNTWDQPDANIIQTSKTNSAVSFAFNGTSITWWGGCFQRGDIPSTNAATAIYSVDGQPPVSFQIDDNSVSGPNCNLEKILFQETLLQLGPHNLTVIYQGDADKMLLSLSSIAYMTTTPSTLQSIGPVPSANISPVTSSNLSNSSIKIAIGSVLGAIVFAFILFFTVIRIRRRKRLSHRTMIPFDVESKPTLRDTMPSDSILHGIGKKAGIPLRSMTALDALSSPNPEVMRPIPGETLQIVPPSDRGSVIEDIRRTRQQELDDRVRAVQQEMMELSSNLSIAEKENGGEETLTTARTMNFDQQVADGGEEMTMDELKAQLRLMTEQVLYLQEQQRSAWALGLSDDPPPGYSPASQRSVPSYSESE